MISTFPRYSSLSCPKLVLRKMVMPPTFRRVLTTYGFDCRFWTALKRKRIQLRRNHNVLIADIDRNGQTAGRACPTGKFVLSGFFNAVCFRRSFSLKPLIGGFVPAGESVCRSSDVPSASYRSTSGMGA